MNKFEKKLEIDVILKTLKNNCIIEKTKNLIDNLQPSSDILYLNHELEKVDEITDQIERDYAKVFPANEPAPVKEMVDHPQHYNNHQHECIDEMIALFGVEAVKGFCKCKW
jgi:dsDNA-specific endonuclease/ATPase MutS2